MRLPNLPHWWPEWLDRYAILPVLCWTLVAGDGVGDIVRRTWAARDVAPLLVGFILAVMMTMLCAAIRGVVQERQRRQRHRSVLHAFAQDALRLRHADLEDEA